MTIYWVWAGAGVGHNIQKVGGFFFVVFDDLFQGDAGAAWHGFRHAGAVIRGAIAGFCVYVAVGFVPNDGGLGFAAWLR